MISRTPRTLIRLFLAIGAMGLLGACGDVKVREYNAARWIVPESSFVYIQHDFTISGEGGSIGRPASNGYPRSAIQVFRLDVRPQGLSGKARLFEMDAVVPCGELVYRRSDSLLFLAYVDLDGTNGMMRHYCPDSVRLVALGKLHGKIWMPLQAPGPDTLRALLNALADSRLDAQGEGSLVIDSAYERLCAGGHCIRSGDR